MLSGVKFSRILFHDALERKQIMSRFLIIKNLCLRIDANIDALSLKWMFSVQHGLLIELSNFYLIYRVEKQNKTKSSFIKPKWNQSGIERNSFFTISSRVIVWCFKHLQPSQEAWRVGRLEEKLSALCNKRPAI